MKYDDYIEAAFRHINDEIDIRLQHKKHKLKLDEEHKNILNAYNYYNSQITWYCNLCTDTSANINNIKISFSRFILNAEEYQNKLNCSSIDFLLNELKEEVNYLYFRKDIEDIEDETKEEEDNFNNYSIFLKNLIEELKNLRLEKEE